MTVTRLLQRSKLGALGHGQILALEFSLAGALTQLLGYGSLALFCYVAGVIVGWQLGASGRRVMGAAVALLTVDVVRLLLGGSPLKDSLGAAAMALLLSGLALEARHWRSAYLARTAAPPALQLDRRVVAAFLALDLLVNARILFWDGFAINGDASAPWPFDNLRRIAWYLFNDAGSVSNLENVDRALYAVPLTSVVHALGLGSATYSKIPWVVFPFVSMLGMYVLILHSLGELKAKSVRTGPVFLACILYAFSPWVLEQVQAPFYWLAYALTPLVVVTSLRLGARPTVSRTVALALLLSLCGTTPQYLLFSVALSAVCLVSARVRHRQLVPLGVWWTSAWLGGAGLLLVLLNASWLLPTWRVLQGGGSVSPGYTLQGSDVALFSRNASTINVLRGYDQWAIWFEHVPALRGLTTPTIAGLTALVPLVALSLLAGRTLWLSPTLRVLSVPTAIATVLSLGTRLPFYEWLVLRSPVVSHYGWLLRVPGKLSYVLWLFMALTIGIAGSTSMPQLKLDVRRGLMSLLVVGAVFGVAIKGTATFFYYYAPIIQPREYSALEAFLREVPPGRVMYLAPYAGSFGRNEQQYETSFTWNRGRLATNTPAISSPIPSVDYYHLTYHDWQPLISQVQNKLSAKDLGTRLLAPAGIRYVVYHADIVGGEVQSAADLRALRDSDLRLVRGFGALLYVFESPSPSQVIAASGAQVDKIDPTRYRIRWHGSTSHDVLDFAQPYDAFWQLEIEGERLDAERTADGYMRFSVPDGARSATLLYSPQVDYERGLWITGFGLLAGLCAVAFERWRRAPSARAQRRVSRAIDDPSATERQPVSTA